LHHPFKAADPRETFPASCVLHPSAAARPRPGYLPRWRIRWIKAQQRARYRSL